MEVGLLVDTLFSSPEGTITPSIVVDIEMVMVCRSYKAEMVIMVYPCAR
jgi:hypothetical protein